MIYLDGLNSIIECMYLEESLSNRVSNCNIFVNPRNIKYLTGKTIIINEPDYPEDYIQTLNSNNCHIISRIFTDDPIIEVNPYILKLNGNVMWNGRIVDTYTSLDSLIPDGLCDLDITNYKLYFPKVILQPKDKTTDAYGNLTGLGWILQQVGINIIKDTPFTNMDILKTGKVTL